MSRRNNTTYLDNHCTRWGAWGTEKVERAEYKEESTRFTNNVKGDMKMNKITEETMITLNYIAKDEADGDDFEIRGYVSYLTNLIENGANTAETVESAKGLLEQAELYYQEYYT